MKESRFERHSKGFALRVRKSNSNHYFGGPHAIEGADCPNCEKPLLKHFTIDCEDERIGLNHLKLATLPLLYCMRCELPWYDFVYDVISPEKISIVQSHTDPKEDRADLLEEWNEEVGGNEFSLKSAELFKIPPGIEALFDKWNEGTEGEFTDEEEDQLSAFDSDYLGEKDYHSDRNLNQLGGRSLLIQGLDDPVCGKCENQMPFLASFKNEKKWGLKLCWDPVQIVFFFCQKCQRVHVQHSI